MGCSWKPRVTPVSDLQAGALCCPAGKALQAVIQGKLKETDFLGPDYADTVLPLYITVMLAHNNTQQTIADSLKAFLGAEKAPLFSSWCAAACNHPSLWRPSPSGSLQTWTGCLQCCLSTLQLGALDCRSFLVDAAELQHCRFPCQCICMLHAGPSSLRFHLADSQHLL